jgi:hypothetical protein
LVDVATDAVQEDTGVGPVAAVLHCCVPEVTQTDEPTGAVQPQVVVVQAGVVLALAVTGVHEGTPVGPLVTTGQAVEVQELPLFAACTLQLPVGLGPVTTVGQLVAIQELPEPALATVHEATGLDVVWVRQLVWTQEFVLLAACAVQD